MTPNTPVAGLAEKLLPCPFCGGVAEVDSYDGHAGTFIQCSGCFARIGSDDEWNRRAIVEAAGSCEDPRLKAAGYLVCGSRADAEWHYRRPDGAWVDRFKSEEVAVKAALAEVAALASPAPSATMRDTLCHKCGQPTMHLGNVCYACSHSTAPAAPSATDLDAMVSRFLGWRLPDDFAPDSGISFTPISNPAWTHDTWPIGTNLLTAVQARAMLEYVLNMPAGAPRAQQPLDETANNAGVATGSRNVSPSESVTPGSPPASLSGAPPSVAGDAGELHDFTEWLAREMPPGTVISDPRWWAPRIARRLAIAEQPGSAVQGEAALRGKYGDVLRPFVVAMEAELHANAGKGDRPGWLAMSPQTALLEIYYHLGKLQRAVKKEGGDLIREYAADVANMSMMLLDICGGLALIEATTPPPAPAAEQAEQFRNGWKAGYAYALNIPEWDDSPIPDPPVTQPEARGVEEMRNALEEISTVAHSDQSESDLETVLAWLASIVDPLLAAAPSGVRADDEMVERGLKAARDASDARLPRYSVVRAILAAALAGKEGSK